MNVTTPSGSKRMDELMIGDKVGLSKQIAMVQCCIAISETIYIWRCQHVALDLMNGLLSNGFLYLCMRMSGGCPAWTAPVELVCIHFNASFP